MTAMFGPPMDRRPKPMDICQHNPCWCGRPPMPASIKPYDQKGTVVWLAVREGIRVKAEQEFQFRAKRKTWLAEHPEYRVHSDESIHYRFCDLFHKGSRKHPAPCSCGGVIYEPA